MKRFYSKVKSIVWNILSINLKRESNIGYISKIVLLNIIMIVGMIFLAILGMIAFMQKNFILGAVDFIVIFILIFMYLFLRVTKRFKLIASIAMSIITIFYFFLFCFGGVNKTAFLWYYTYPLIALFIMGKKTGTWLVLFLLMCSVIVQHFAPSNDFIVQYPWDLMIRFFASYFVVFLFAYFWEYVRNFVIDELKTTMTDLQYSMDVIAAINEELSTTRDKLWAEMELAKRIQVALLPENPQITGFDVEVFMEPAKEVGGDYYDIFEFEKRIWLIIGDVSGHGVPAGLIMMMVQTAIHVTLEQNPGIKPSFLLELINRTITRNINLMNEDKYMTITVMAMIEDNVLNFSGLHQDILLYRKKDNKIEIYNTNGIWLGILDDIGEKLSNNSLKLESGDSLLLYTDGITEAWVKGSVRNKRNPDAEMYGNDRLIAFFGDNGMKPVKDIKQALLDDLKNYNCDDDVTFVIVKKL